MGTGDSDRELTDQEKTLRRAMAMAEFRQLQDDNTRLRSLLTRWLRCYQQEGSQPLLHAETQAALEGESNAY